MPTITGYPRILATAVVPGGAAATPLGPCGGILTTDTLVEVRHVSGDGSLTVNASVKAEASIPAPDRVQLTTTVTTGNFLVVVWQRAG